jgi:PTS system nitrogen regulatory IIA component
MADPAGRAGPRARNDKMKICDLLSPARIVCQSDVASKKRALEVLSQVMAESREDLVQTEIFDSLISRERLGSTGLGYGVAIPHGRLERLDQAVGAFMQLSEGIDYDALDKQPVDLLFVLLVPREATEDHLNILATLAEMFKDEGLRQALRNAKSVDELYALFSRRDVMQTQTA